MCHHRLVSCIAALLTPADSSLGFGFLLTFIVRGPWNVTALMCPSELKDWSVDVANHFDDTLTGEHDMALLSMHAGLNDETAGQLWGTAVCTD